MNPSQGMRMQFKAGAVVATADNPPQYRKYVREKELAKKNYQPKFPD